MTSPASRPDTEPTFIDFTAAFAGRSKDFQLCRFPSTGEWSLREKFANGDVAHVKYLTQFERAMVEAAMAVRSERGAMPTDDEISKTLYAYEGALSEQDDDQEGLTKARNDLIELMRRLRRAASNERPESPR